MWQAEHVHDRNVRDTMTAIAEDETRHAALACSVAQWLEPTLDAEARARIDEAVATRMRELTASTMQPPPRALMAAGLLPIAAEAAGLLQALASALSVTRPA